MVFRKIATLRDGGHSEGLRVDHQERTVDQIEFWSDSHNGHCWPIEGGGGGILNGGDQHFSQTTIRILLQRASAAFEMNVAFFFKGLWFLFTQKYCSKRGKYFFPSYCNFIRIIFYLFFLFIYPFHHFLFISSLFNEPFLLKLFSGTFL